MNETMQPFNGAFYARDGTILNLDGGVGNGAPNMSPMGGQFVGSDGEVKWLEDFLGGSGGSGTTNYAALTNKPQIGGVTLNGGNNDIAALGLASAADLKIGDI
jgi:hypothetical protein